MQDLHNKEKEIVRSAMQKVGSPQKGKAKNTLTTPNLTRWLCMFYGAYHSMILKMGRAPPNDPIFFKIGNEEKKGFNQIKEICEVLAQTHNARVHADFKRRMDVLESIPTRKLRTELKFKIELVSTLCSRGGNERNVLLIYMFDSLSKIYPVPFAIIGVS